MIWVNSGGGLDHGGCGEDGEKWTDCKYNFGGRSWQPECGMLEHR